MKQNKRDENFICMKCVPIIANECSTIPEEITNEDGEDIPHVEESNV